MIAGRLVSKRKRSLSGDDEEQEFSSKAARKKNGSRKICAADGCTNMSQSEGVCKRHGANSEEREVPAKVVRKIYECSVDGCTNHYKNGGVCIRHGAKVKRCSSVGCTNQAYKGGVASANQNKIAILPRPR